MYKHTHIPTTVTLAHNNMNKYTHILVAKPARAVKYTNCIFTERQGFLNDDPCMTLSGNAGALGNVEYPFIAIAPSSTVAQSGSTG